MCTITKLTPTITEYGNNDSIIKRNNHISIDCGCVYGYKLAVSCIDTDMEVYISNTLETSLSQNT